MSKYLWSASAMYCSGKWTDKYYHNVSHAHVTKYNVQRRNMHKVSSDHCSDNAWMTEDPPYGFREVGISNLFSLCWTTGSTTMIVWWCQYTPLPTTSLGRRSLCWWNMNHLGRCCFLRAHFLRVQDWSSISPSELWESPLLPTWLTRVCLRHLPFSIIATQSSSVPLIWVFTDKTDRDIVEYTAADTDYYIL